ncbi:unnamed protein product [Amoebophrya sp. A120]|nr:unnamed protein product [Amoebophrya sp. A120]|eukprot:GSA120T00010331001.1
MAGDKKNKENSLRGRFSKYACRKRGRRLAFAEFGFAWFFSTPAQPAEAEKQGRPGFMQRRHQVHPAAPGDADDQTATSEATPGAAAAQGSANGDWDEFLDGTSSGDLGSPPGHARAGASEEREDDLEAGGRSAATATTPQDLAVPGAVPPQPVLAELDDESATSALERNIDPLAILAQPHANIISLLGAAPDDSQPSSTESGLLDDWERVTGRDECVALPLSEDEDKWWRPDIGPESRFWNNLMKGKCQDVTLILLNLQAWGLTPGLQSRVADYMERDLANIEVVGALITVAFNNVSGWWERVKQQTKYKIFKAPEAKKISGFTCYATFLVDGFDEPTNVYHDALAHGHRELFPKLVGGEHFEKTILPLIREVERISRCVKYVGPKGEDDSVTVLAYGTEPGSNGQALWLQKTGPGMKTYYRHQGTADDLNKKVIDARRPYGWVFLPSPNAWEQKFLDKGDAGRASAAPVEFFQVGETREDEARGRFFDELENLLEAQFRKALLLHIDRMDADKNGLLCPNEITDYLIKHSLEPTIELILASLKWSLKMYLVAAGNTLSVLWPKLREIIERKTDAAVHLAVMQMRSTLIEGISADSDGDGQKSNPRESERKELDLRFEENWGFRGSCVSTKPPMKGPGTPRGGRHTGIRGTDPEFLSLQKLWLQRVATRLVRLFVKEFRLKDAAPSGIAKDNDLEQLYKDAVLPPDEQIALKREELTTRQNEERRQAKEDSNRLDVAFGHSTGDLLHTVMFP